MGKVTDFVPKDDCFDDVIGKRYVICPHIEVDHLEKEVDYK